MDNNIVKAIPLEDVSEFTMTIKPTEKELEIIFSYGFKLISKVIRANGNTYYTFRRKYYE